jgi:integrating conjugative element protein (TIGR03757 family)
MKTINKIVAMALLTSIGFSLPSHAQDARMIEVFTDQPAFVDRLAGATVVHYDLSELDRLKQTGLPHLPANESLAKEKAIAFFASPEGAKFKEGIKGAMRGHQKMMRYNLQKIPAVVFDQGKYVVYGTTDVAEAARLYQVHMFGSQAHSTEEVN